MIRVTTAVGCFAMICLSSCGTPQERCERAVSAEYTQVSRLLAEVQANIARGYAWENEVSDGVGLSLCAGGFDGGGWGWGGVGFGTCYGDTNVVRKRVPIDPAAEMRKRDALQARLEVLSTRGTAACIASPGQAS